MEFHEKQRVIFFVTHLSLALPLENLFSLSPQNRWNNLLAENEEKQRREPTSSSGKGTEDWNSLKRVWKELP
ncbi:Hypothetical predicted protein [Marmota monax]|uniref:Uncharacterized protein n=1 Tax=Marmota monax TaxID=9995 RepID=A0A5E4CTN2_MARMO|nr:hypothetical protein GHT09_003622 [Marmota monax]VTJ84371.1 Hypothetical predicted protein [Marmota monax]